MIESHWRIWQLADSAFPTGGFAHSGGLEAAWQSGEIPDATALARFVHDVAVQTGRSVLPFLTAAHRRPDKVAALDLACDVFVVNAVANRASRMQGRAFLSTCLRVWPSAALDRLEAHTRDGSGHAAPVIGATLRVLEVDLDTAQRLFLFNSVRGVFAAAVRLGIVGSYQAQRLQHHCMPLVDEIVSRCGGLDPSDAANTAPIVDLLQAAHDRLYSRLFQS
jgi:urease accessory protein